MKFLRFYSEVDMLVTNYIVSRTKLSGQTSGTSFNVARLRCFYCVSLFYIDYSGNNWNGYLHFCINKSCLTVVLQ